LGGDQYLNLFFDQLSNGTEHTKTEKVLAYADLPVIKDFEFRVDAHPAWDSSDGRSFSIARKMIPVVYG